MVYRLLFCMMISGLAVSAQVSRDTSFQYTRVLIKTNRNNQATYYLNQHQERLAGLDSFHLYRGWALLNSGNTEQAEKELLLCIQKDTTNGTAWDMLARIYCPAGRVPECKRAIDSHLRHNPRQFSTRYYYFGTLQLAAGYPEGTVSLMRSALNENPDDANCAMLYAYALMESNRPRDGYLFLDEFLERNPTSCEGLYMMGKLMGEHLGMTDPALEKLLQAADLCNDTLKAETFFTMARIFETIDEIEPAVKAYDASLQLLPNHKGALWNAGILKTSLLQTTEAIDHFNTYLEVYGPDAEAYFQLGLCLELENRNEESIAQYTEALRIDSTMSECWFNRGNVHMKLNNLDEAIIDYTKALELDADQADYWYNRGQAYYSKAMYRYSEKDMNSYLILKPEDAMGYFVRGNARYYGDNPHGACSDWEECIRLGRKDLWKKVRSICR
jgi:tetratricopeptide (TPR) repeat protein